MKKSIEEQIAASPAPRITDYYSQGFNILFKQPGMFIGFIIIFFLINFGVSLVPLGGLVFSFFFQPLLIVGCFIVADKINYQERVEFGNFFDSFRGNMSNILVTNLLMAVMYIIPMGLLVAGIILAFGLPFIQAVLEQSTPDIDSFSGFSAGAMILFLLGFIIVMYLAVSYMFALHMAKFKELGPWESLEASRKLIGKNFGSFFLFALLGGLINLAGALLLLIGLLFTIPATYIAMYVAFDDMVKAREDHNEEDAIIDHFIA